MGYFDIIQTEENKNINIDNTEIVADWYQSKDFMYNDNGRYWEGDNYIISKDGYLYFEEDELKKISITGLVNIYSGNINNDTNYWLLIDNNKIIKVYKDMYFEELPSEVKKDLNIHFGEGYSLNVNIKKLDSKKSQRLLKKRKKRVSKKHKTFSNCKTKKVLKRKKRKKSLRLKHLLICIEKYPPLLLLDETSAFFDGDDYTILEKLKRIKKNIHYLRTIYKPIQGDKER